MKGQHKQNMMGYVKYLKSEDRQDWKFIEAECQLSDRTFYDQIDNALIDKHHKYISETIKTFMKTGDLPSTAYHPTWPILEPTIFYFLPIKDH